MAHEGETPIPAEGPGEPTHEDVVEATAIGVETIHSAAVFCNDLKPESREPEESPRVVVCANCPEDPDTQFSNPPVLWREGEGFVR